MPYHLRQGLSGCNQLFEQTPIDGVRVRQIEPLMKRRGVLVGKLRDSANTSITKCYGESGSHAFDTHHVAVMGQIRKVGIIDIDSVRDIHAISGCRGALDELGAGADTERFEFAKIILAN